MKDAVLNLYNLVAGFKWIAVNGFFLPLCLCTSSCGQEVDTVVKKVFEQDKDKDGAPDLRIETHTRGETRVFIRMERKLQNGAWSVTQSYLVSGEIFSVEEDEDGDGFFETLIVFNPPKNGLEVFLREKDGSTVVASADVKASYQKMLGAVDEFWDQDPSALDEKTVEELIDETKQRIGSAGKELEDQERQSPVENKERQKPDVNPAGVPPKGEKESSAPQAGAE